LRHGKLAAAFYYRQALGHRFPGLSLKSGHFFISDE
jgi:hypothetical protein